MKIVCYGDSNTFGWDPRFFSSNHYAHPWPELMGELTGHDVVNCGEPGRTVPYLDEHLEWFARDVKTNSPDLLVIMLGTNDLFYTFDPTAEAVAARMEKMIRYAKQNSLSPRIMLLSCAHVEMPGEPYVDILEDMSVWYGKIAGQENIGFADPFRWNIPLSYDGVHFTKEGHRIFAKEMSRLVNAI